MGESMTNRHAVRNDQLLHDPLHPAVPECRTALIARVGELDLARLQELPVNANGKIDPRSAAELATT
jgi:hypothetical protein